MTRAIIVAALFAAACSGGALPSTPGTTMSAGAAEPDFLTLQLPKMVPVCDPSRPGAHCTARVLRYANGQIVPGKPDGVPVPNGLGATDLESAYAVDPSQQRSQVVAVIEAYDHPNAEADLATYRAQYGLPPCSSATGCFTKINQNGANSPLPPVQPLPPVNQWDLEMSLDLDMISAGCPSCKILLVEAVDDSDPNFKLANAAAIARGAVAVSNSWEDHEFATEATEPSAFNLPHPGSTIFASAGDHAFAVDSNGVNYEVGWPGALGSVVVVGGTMLTKDPGSARGWDETVWPDTTSGCSAYAPKPSWQKDSGCRTRTVADIAAVADNVAIFDSHDGGWFTSGGTSAAAPLVAGIFAGNGDFGASPSLAYDEPTLFNDITTGETTCPSYLCVAGAGYDGVSGMGTPIGSRLQRQIPASQDGLSAAVSRSPEHMDVFWVGNSGTVMWSAWQPIGGWKTSTLSSGGGNVGALSHLTAVSRNPGRVEAFWITKNGAVEHFVHDDTTVPGWSITQLDPSGSATPDGGIAAVSRAPDTVELWYVAADHSIRDRDWYDSAGAWSGATLAGSGAAANTSSIAALSRVPNSMEVFYVGASGSIEDLYFYDGQGWRAQQLAPPASAALQTTIAAVSRLPNMMELWWGTPNGAILNRNIVAGGAWTGYQLLGPGATTVISPITVSSRNSGEFELMFFRPDQSIMLAEWTLANSWSTFAVTGPTQVYPGGMLTSLSRLPETREIWYSTLSKSLQDDFWYGYTSLTFGTSVLSPANTTIE